MRVTTHISLRVTRLSYNSVASLMRAKTWSGEARKRRELSLKTSRRGCPGDV
jgi:hypothetical protein